MYSPATLGARDTRVSPACAADETRRWMRIKVLYTFDQGHTNCLARLPDPVNVQVFNVDRTTQIGVVGINSCVLAVVAASPELMNTLGQDYTVYAHDYSEDQHPLVGHGRLSSFLGHQSSTVVTGRVCRNVLGVFASDGIREILEVTLRLVAFSTLDQGLDTWFLPTHDNKDTHPNIPSSPPPLLPDLTPTPSSPPPQFFSAPHDSGFLSDNLGGDIHSDYPSCAAPQPVRRHHITIPPRHPTLEELQKSYHNPRRRASRSQDQPQSTVPPPPLPPPPPPQTSTTRPQPRPVQLPTTQSVPTVATTVTTATVAELREETPRAFSESRPSTPCQSRSQSPVKSERFSQPMSRTQSFSGWQPNPGDVIYEPGATGVPQPRSGSGAKRRKIIQDNLQTCLATGQMPPYCRNCGDVQPSGWRKTFAKTINAADMPALEGEPNIVGRENVECDDDGQPIKIRVFKKAIGGWEKVDGLWEQLQLCNACGIFLSKYAHMRPPTKWNKDPPSRRNRRPKNQGPNSDLPTIYTDPPEPPPPTRVNSFQQQPRPSSAHATSDAPQAHPPQGAKRPTPQTVVIEDDPPPKRRCSPPQTPAQQEIQPSVEFDLTGVDTPTRLLFPSPRDTGEFKSLDGSAHRTQGDDQAHDDPEPADPSAVFIVDDEDDEDDARDKENENPNTHHHVPNPHATPKRNENVTTTAPMTTPFTAKVNALLNSDLIVSPTPGTALDFPTFSTPPRVGLYKSISQPAREHDDDYLDEFFLTTVERTEKTRRASSAPDTGGDDENRENCDTTLAHGVDVEFAVSKTTGDLTTADAENVTASPTRKQDVDPVAYHRMSFAEKCAFAASECWGTRGDWEKHHRRKAPGGPPPGIPPKPKESLCETLR